MALAGVRRNPRRVLHSHPWASAPAPRRAQSRFVRPIFDIRKIRPRPKRRQLPPTRSKFVSSWPPHHLRQRSCICDCPIGKDFSTSKSDTENALRTTLFPLVEFGSLRMDGFRAKLLTTDRITGGK